MNSETLAATGLDHASFAIQDMLLATDEAVLNSAGTPRRLPLALLRGLFMPGSNIAIDQNGTISALASAGSGSADITALPTTTTTSAADLITIEQSGSACAISYANFIAGQTIAEVAAAAPVSDTDAMLVAQVGNALLRQSFAAIWTWLAAKLPLYQVPTAELTVNTVLSTSLHNTRILICSQPISITAVAADLGGGFTCEVLNLSAGTVTLSAGIITSSGTQSIPPGQAAVLNSASYSGGAIVYARITSPSTLVPTAQVTGLTTTSVSAASITLAWTAPLPAPSSYQVQYRVAGTSGWSSAPSVTVPNCTVNGLLSATSYDFIVSAISGAGTGTPSSILTVTTAVGLNAPGQVTGLAASAPTTTGMTLAWSPPGTGGAVTGYTVQYRINGTSGWTTAASGQSATSLTVSALLSATSYDFQVFASNTAGAGPASNVVTASTTTAGTPVTAVSWNLAPVGPYTHGTGSIAVNAHITPSNAPVRYGVSTSSSVAPSSWTAGNYVNNDLWGAYISTPPAPGTYYVWVEGVDGSHPTAYATPFSVT
jgi:hypothetical protein